MVARRRVVQDLTPKTNRAKKDKKTKWLPVKHTNYLKQEEEDEFTELEKKVSFVMLMLIGG